MSISTLVLAVLLVATWSGIFWIYRKLSHDIDELARERVEQVEMQSNIARMVAQLQLAADELGEALAARTGRLQELLGDADQRTADAARMVAQLTQLLMAHEQAQQAALQAQQALQAQHSANAETLPASAREVSDARVAPDEATRDRTEPVRTVGSYDEVRRLAAQGWDISTIAQLTGRGREEVRLFLQFAQAAHGTRSAQSEAQPMTPAAASVAGR